MGSKLIFYIGLALDAFALLISANSLMSSRSAPNGLSPTGRIMAWALPLLLLTFIGLAFWLHSNGNTLAANILLWIPALPMLIGIAIWGGLALIFILFGK